jgi:transposase-like protein
MVKKDSENKQSCSCAQTATDLLKTVPPIKEGMLKEIKCKGCRKTFLTNFGTEYCYDCLKRMKAEA